MLTKFFALTNWFSPVDVESPTIETIEFSNTENYKNVPFDIVNRIDFSETMWSLDLVVSVTHVDGFNPKANHSTIDMRQSLIKETIRLLDIENISIKKNRLIIKGSSFDYSLH